MKIKVAQKTDVGLIRRENQDDMGWFSLPSGELFIVADGMGGEAGGKEAARMAISAIRKTFEKGGDSIPALMESSIIRANRQIHQKGTSGDPEYRKMGTTLVVLLINNSHAYMAHVGDSRIYCYREGRLERLTRDHSRIQQMLDDGIISPEEAEGHPDAHIINRALGARPEVVPEIRDTPIDIRPDDLFMLCTDGLCGLLNDSEIFKIFRRGGSVETLCDHLISAALQKGGQDNVTVQLVHFESEGSSLESPETNGRTTKGGRKRVSSVFLWTTLLLTVLGAFLWWYFVRRGGG